MDIKVIEGPLTAVSENTETAGVLVIIAFIGRCPGKAAVRGALINFI